MAPDPIHALQQSIARFGFTSYGHHPKHAGITAAELSEKTGCGLLPARVIIEALPHESGVFHTPGWRVLNNSGIDIFIAMALHRIPEITAQGYVNILTDTCGTLIMIPLHASSLDHVVLIDVETADPENLDLKEVGNLYAGTLFDLLHQRLLHPTSNLFENSTPFTGD